MTNEAYILQHRDEDVHRLALSKAPDGVDRQWCLQQIEGWQTARHKLPLWAATEGLWYPPRLGMEQCSSQQTAEYKRRVAERLVAAGRRTAMADLTGGLGIDFAALAPLFHRRTYVEVQPHLQELARHNLPLLGLPDANVLSPTDFRLEADHYALLYLDPSRRDSAGRKTVRIEDCTPNLAEWQEGLLAHCQWLMVKFSPMLDIREALRQLQGVREVHVVGVRGECKELLFAMQGRECAAPSDADEAPAPVVHCVNLDTDDDLLTTPLAGPQSIPTGQAMETDVEQLTADVASGQTVYLYEPNASVLKAGVQDALPSRYPVQKLHPMSHLFVSNSLLLGFPGRCFRIEAVGDFSKQGLRHLVGDLRQANLTVRNFPSDVATLRRRLRLAEGGDVYFFATTLSKGQHSLIRCKKP